MKKKIFYTLIGLLFILLLLYLIRYKISDNYKNRIPENATAIVRIDIRQLEHHFLADALKNPMTYFRSSKKSKKDSLKTTVKKKNTSILKALKIPKNILFYSTDKTSDKTWKSDPIKINNLNVLKNILEHQNFKPLQHKGNTIYHKKGIKISIKKEELIIVINSKKSITNSNLWLDNIKFIDKKSVLYNNLIKNKSDIAYITEKENINFNFNNGEIIGNGFANFDLFTNSKQEVFTNNIGMLSVSINKEHYFFKKYYNGINKEKFRNNFKLNIDSLSSKWNGKLQLNLFDFKLKTDTIKTYEYDDDFNKIEKIATQKTSLLEFKLSLNNSNSELSKYLVRKNAIQIVENDSVFVSFPLTKVFINQKNENLNFGNNIKTRISKKIIKNKLSLKFDFENYRQKTKNTPFFYFNNLKNLKKCDISISNDNNIKFIIKMKAENRNALVQLFNFN